MDFEKLFVLVHGLTERQKRNFARFNSGKTDTMPLLLYKRILAEDELNAESIEKIKAGEFRNIGTFCNNRNELINLIIRSLVHYEYDSVSIIPFIKQAFLYEATKLGEDTLTEVLHQSIEIEDFAQLIRLYDLIDELKLQYEIEFDIPAGFPTFLEALDELSFQRELNIWMEELSKAAKCDIETQFDVAGKINAQIRPQYHSRTCKLLRTRALMYISFLRRDLNSAFDLGVRLIKGLEEWPEKYSLTFLASEMSKIAMQAAALLDRDVAYDYTMRLSAIIGDSPHSRTQMERSRLTVGATIAGVFAEKGLADICFDELQRTTVIFPERLIPKLYHNLGRAFFFNGAFGQSIRCFNIVRSLLKRKFPFLKWEPQVFLAIAHFELGELGEVEGLLRSARRAAKSLPEKYPTTAINIIFKYCLGNSVSSPITMSNAEALKSLLGSQVEKKSSQDFPVELWVESKCRNVSLKEVLLERIAHEKAEIESLSGMA